MNSETLARIAVWSSLIWWIIVAGIQSGRLAALQEQTEQHICTEVTTDDNG